MDARNSNYIQGLTKMIADLRQESYKQLQRIEALEKDGVAIRLNPGVTIQGPAILRTRIKSEQQPQQPKQDDRLDALRLARPHELFPDHPAPATEGSSATAPPAPNDRLRWCPTHGQQPRNAWGCPECVRELRAAATLLQQIEAQYGVQRRHPSPATIAECGGPCDSQGPEACDCGLLQELNPPSPAHAVGLVDTICRQLPLSPGEARAVVREVASWLRSDGPDWPSVASLLEQEVNR
jgi:hypothetical protein